jgi:hypothetical protein
MQDDRNKKSLYKWELKRKKGKLRYILIEGLTGWGGTIFILSLIFLFLFDSPNKIDILLSFLFSLSIGGLWSEILWNKKEKLYHSENEDKDILNNNDKPLKILKRIEGFEDEFPGLEFESSGNSKDNIDIKTYQGKLVDVPFINKAGRKIEGSSSMFFETEDKRYFIKSYEGEITYSELRKHIGKPIRLKARKTFGLWDTDDPGVQSRIGEFFTVIEILEDDT